MRNLIVIAFSFLTLAVQSQTIRVGAKHFNEGYILSEMIAQLLESEGYAVERKYNLGGTLVCYQALQNNEIDIYPEYSGTISAEILQVKNKISFDEIKIMLADKLDMEMSEPYGFNNTYALVIKDALAKQENIFLISDLKKHRALKAGISYEFLKRQDGWDNLAKAYSLRQKPTGLEHGLAYQALNEDKIDFTDAYSTDGEIPANHLVVLKDDLGFFPTYEAASFYKKNLSDSIKRILSRLDNKISEDEMQAMNAAVLYEKKTFAQVAASFLNRKQLVNAEVKKETSAYSDLLSKTGRHLLLTFAGLFIAILVALPLAVLLHWLPFLAKPVLYLTGLMQTIPSIALLAFMIPFLGIGITPAIVALFLYALLPILRNTATGLQGVDPLLKKVAEGIGMNRIQKLRRVELPLAMPTIFAGIRTAAVINVGTATLAAFIGAGGLGEYIVTGLALNNTSLILRGALPAAALALLVEFIFELLEKASVPPHLRM